MAKQFGLTKNTFFIPRDARIIRADEYRDMVDGSSIIQTANERAEEILLQAEKERAKCHRLGYLEGFQEARELVLQEMVSVYAKAGEYLQDAEETLMQIVVASLKKITGDSLDQGVIQNQLQKAVKEELVRGRLKIRLHPDVAERVGQELYQLANRHPVIDYLEVVKDTNVDRSSCLIESDLGVVDMSIDRQLKALFAVIKRYIPEAVELSETAEEVMATLNTPSDEEVVKRLDDSGLLEAKAKRKNGLSSHEEGSSVPVQELAGSATLDGGTVENRVDSEGVGNLVPPPPVVSKSRKGESNSNAKPEGAASAVEKSSTLQNVPEARKGAP